MSQWTPDDTARLALDLGRAKRRIAELEAAEGRVRALHFELTGAPWCSKCGGRWPCSTTRALDGPPDDQQVREV